MEDQPAQFQSRYKDRAPAPRPALGKLFEQPLPHSLEAEMALLGSMLLDPEVIPDVVPFVGAREDFHLESHSAIFDSIIEIYDRHKTGDLVLILDALRTQGKLDLIGGDAYLLQLAEGVPSAANATYYAKIVAEKAKLRRLVMAAETILYDAMNVGDVGAGPEGAKAVLDKAEAAIFKIAEQDEKGDPQRLADLLEVELERIRQAEGVGISGVPTGFADLDKLLSGLQRGEMLILAARPSMGKTAFALNLAEQISRGGITPFDRDDNRRIPVGFFSLEMSKAAVSQRLLSAFADVDSHKIRTGEVSRAELSRLELASSESLSTLPLYIDDTPGLSILGLRSRARRMRDRHRIEVIFIDYLQLLSAPGSARESRQVEVSAISRGIKALARELNVPIVCLSQLNRASEQREGNRPRMSDLRESGSIEQDADVVMLLHREDYYHSSDANWAHENPDKVGLAEIIIAKQRNGPTGVVKLTWDSKITRFKSHTEAGGLASGGFGSARGGSYAGLGAPDPFNGFGAPEPKPDPGAYAPPPRPGFPAGPRTGPVQDFRDGGGPDPDEEGAPF